MRNASLYILLVLMLAACTFRRELLQLPAGTAATFSSVQRFILAPKCMSCHIGPNSPHGVDLGTYENIMGSSEKKFLKLAWPKRKKVAKKNQPVTSKNIAITI